MGQVFPIHPGLLADPSYRWGMSLTEGKLKVMSRVS